MGSGVGGGRGRPNVIQSHLWRFHVYFRSVWHSFSSQDCKGDIQLAASLSLSVGNTRAYQEAELKSKPMGDLRTVARQHGVALKRRKEDLVNAIVHYLCTLP